jgi:ketosteroid isomerase-like protein
MKRLTVMLLILAAGLGAKAQSKDEITVTAGVEKLRLAMMSGDKEELESVLSPDLTYGHSGGKIEDKAAFVDAITTKKSDFVSIVLTDQTISVTGDVAIVRHILSAETNDGGKPGTVHLGIVLVWKKNKGNWKMIARRAFKVPA